MGREADAFYWHRFFSHQPDLNYENAEVQQAILDLVSFWISAGVDGFRIDAAPYLFEEEDTTCDNLPATHAFLRKLRQHVNDNFPHALLLAETNLWPEDLVQYFGEGDEFHMAYHFPIMPRLFMALRQEDRRPIVGDTCTHAGNPARLSVGNVSQESRRADAGDGYR